MKKIIHIDMDCYFAAIHMRDFPEFKKGPLAVGGAPDKRGVIATCNYVARQYGVKSAMSSRQALKLCPQLIIVCPHYERYHEETLKIRKIFRNYTDLVEPMALDEAYLDVSDNKCFKGDAVRIAEEIRRRIYEQTRLTSSAGVAPNKFLAKVASSLNKPNGLYSIGEKDVGSFVKDLPVEKIWGVGKVTAAKLHKLGVKSCLDLQEFTESELAQRFGKMGKNLYWYCRGVDDRDVIPEQEKKSFSTEKTFPTDLKTFSESEHMLKEIFHEFNSDLTSLCSDTMSKINKIYIKIKFDDFRQTTVEKSLTIPTWNAYKSLFQKGYLRKRRPIRLLGMGVRFSEIQAEHNPNQLLLFPLS